MTKHATHVAPQRVMFVHAHPDDESLFTGLLVAASSRVGAETSVLTCTLGEEGEVIGEKYQNLISEHSGLLGGFRIGELQRALEHLGVHQGPQFLGGLSRWRDSGMADTPAIRHPHAFAGDSEDNWEQQVGQLLAVLRRERPDVLVTYGPDGGYGHPDHIRAHRVTHEAVRRLADAGEEATPQEIWWAVTPAGAFHAVMAGAEIPEGWREPKDGDVALVAEDFIDAFVQGAPEDVAAKRKAMAAHATQLWVADGSRTDVNPDARDVTTPTGEYLFALSNLISQPILPVEGYQLGWVKNSDPNTNRQISLLHFDFVVPSNGTAQEHGTDGKAQGEDG